MGAWDYELLGALGKLGEQIFSISNQIGLEQMGERPSHRNKLQ
jgi:hypothetical protein